MKEKMNHFFFQLSSPIHTEISGSTQIFLPFLYKSHMFLFPKQTGQNVVRRGLGLFVQVESIELLIPSYFIMET